MTEEQKQELNAVTSLRLYWPEYVMELTEMVVYLAFICIFATLVAASRLADSSSASE
jgi:hypothetical protein